MVERREGCGLELQRLKEEEGTSVLSPRSE